MKVLVISQRKLLPMTDGALIGSMGLLNYLHDLGHTIQVIHFIEDKDYSREELLQLNEIVDKVHVVKLFWRSTALNISFRYPNSIRKYKRAIFEKKVMQVKKDFEPDFAVIDHTQMYEYSKCFKDMYYVLHTHNVESNVWFSYAQNKRGLVKCLVNRTAKMMRDYEINALRESPSVTACSETDTTFFKGLVPSANVATFHSYLKFPIVKTLQDIKKLNKTIIFIGSYSWYPNQISARFLINEVMPILRKRLFGVKLILVGKSPTEEMMKDAKRYDDITVTGMVDSVDPYIKTADVFVNAIEDGGGINIKLIETMGKGIPVVTSKFGSRGINIRDGYNALIYSNTDECVEKIMCFMNNKDLAIKCSINARLEYELFIQPNEQVKNMFCPNEV